VGGREIRVIRLASIVHYAATPTAASDERQPIAARRSSRLVLRCIQTAVGHAPVEHSRHVGANLLPLVVAPTAFGSR
jgi:hypothetical protein